MQRGRSQLLRIFSTEIADAGRFATGASITTNRTCTGYVRVISGSACARCIILAGNVYHSAVAFKRHPHCDCVHQPTIRGHSKGYTDPKEYFQNLSKAEQDRVFGRAGAQAIRDGADIYRVVNARRKAAGLQSAAENQLGLLRQQGILSDVQALSGNPRITFSRTISQDRRDKRVRVMPETIYRIARDRDHAIELLKANGFITEDYRDRLMRVRGFV